MKKLLILVVLASIANASPVMCDMYWDRLLEENAKLQRAAKLKQGFAITAQYKELIYYSTKVAMECKQGSQREQLATKTINYAERALGIKNVKR